MQLLFFVLAGAVFGLANVIPGVSGGTMAVVFGVYERLLAILSDPLHNIKKEWKFLVTFAVGAVVAILAFGKLMNWLLTAYAAEAAMFFIGVILGSIPGLFKSAFLSAKKLTITPAGIIAFAIGLGIMIPMMLSGDDTAAKEAAKAGSVQGGVNVLQMLMMVVYGIIASATMIIPGISGSFIMLLIGVYGPLMAAIAALTSFGSGMVSAILTLLPFGIGVVIGLVYCSRLIKFLLKKFPTITYAAILGFVIGSIGCVFPGFDKVSVAGIICVFAGIALLWGCSRISPKE